MSIFQTSINSFVEPLLVLDYVSQKNDMTLIKISINQKKRVLNKEPLIKQEVEALKQVFENLSKKQAVIVSQVRRRYIQLPDAPSPEKIAQILENITHSSQGPLETYVSRLSRFNFPELFCNTLTEIPLPVVEEIDEHNPIQHSSCLLTNASKTAIRIALDKNIFCYYRFEADKKTNYTCQLKLGAPLGTFATHFHLSEKYTFKTNEDFWNTVNFKKHIEPLQNTLKVYKEIPKWEIAMTCHLSNIINITRPVCTIISKYMLDPYALPVNELTEALDLTPFEEMAKKKAASQ